jgi:hypothetical protein
METFMRIRDWLAVPAALFCVAGWAQLAGDNPDWKESPVPPPPAFELSRLLPFEVGASTALSFGVDPATLSIGSDGVVHYVVVARSPGGTVNAMYEGIRCATAEFKTYARYNGGSWNSVAAPEWRSVYTPAPSMHPLQFAKQGGCNGKAPPQTVRDIVRDLKNQNYQQLR